MATDWTLLQMLKLKRGIDYKVLNFFGGEKPPFGLIVLPHKDDYLVYSATAKKFARIPNANMDFDVAKAKLEKEGFFENPVKQPDRTVRVTLIVTTDCNLRCKYCYANAGERPEYMPVWLAHKAIEYAVSSDADELFISFFGGEPTLNFEVIKDVIQDIESKNIPFKPIISTNGIIGDDVLRFLIDKKFIVKLSLDGPPDIQNKYRVFADGRYSSKIVESTIKTLVRKETQLRVRVTLTMETLARVEEIINYLASLGVNIVHMELVAPRGRAEAKNFEQPTPDEYVEAIMAAISRCRKKGFSSLLLLFFAFLHQQLTIAHP